MGIWARDKADQEDWTPPGYTYQPAPRPQPRTFECKECHRTFTDFNAFRNHRFDGHNLARPILVLQDRELDRSQPVIAERPHPTDWRTVDALEATVNGRAVGLRHLGAALASLPNGVASVVLEGDRTTTRYELRFQVADDAELAEVDDHLMQLGFQEQLSVTGIGALVDRLRHHRSSSAYVGGITDYLYGVLAREGAPDSGLEPWQYRDKYESALASLMPYRRPIADAIVGLITFHFNQFDEARHRSGAGRIASIARRLRSIELGIPCDTEIDKTEGDLDLGFLLSDARTEQILDWCAIPLGTEADQRLEDAERGISVHEGYDQRKIRLLAIEAWLRCGQPDRIHPHLRALRIGDADEDLVTRIERALAEGTVP